MVRRLLVAAALVARGSIRPATRRGFVSNASRSRDMSRQQADEVAPVGRICRAMSSVVQWLTFWAMSVVK